MRYINVKTGAVIESASVVSGGDWKPLVEEKKETAKKASKKTTKKKSGDA